MTARNDIKKKRGDTRRIVFVIKSGSTPVDISSWTDFIMTIDPSAAPVDDTTKVEEIAGVLASDGADGRVYFVPGGTLEPGAYFYDAQALDDNSEKITFSEGRYTVTQDITKD